MTYGVSTAAIWSAALPFSPQEIKVFGTTVVFAPHPDDESLACGGMIALLRSMQIRVKVIFVSDGSLSHPSSKKYPAKQLVKLRHDEALAALHFLEVGEEEVSFLNMKDGSVPGKGMEGFGHAVNVVAAKLQRINPGTIILPWRRDTHKDHRACWQLVNDASSRLVQQALMLEYPLWLWERGTTGDLPANEEINIRSVDISKFLEAKKSAIHAHKSQVSLLIDDDPDGFWLSPEMISNFTGPKEIFMVSATNPSNPKI